MLRYEPGRHFKRHPLKVGLPRIVFRTKPSRSHSCLMRLEASGLYPLSRHHSLYLRYRRLLSSRRSGSTLQHSSTNAAGTSLPALKLSLASRISGEIEKHRCASRQSRPSSVQLRMPDPSILMSSFTSGFRLPWTAGKGTICARLKSPALGLRTCGSSFIAHRILATGRTRSEER